MSRADKRPSKRCFSQFNLMSFWSPYLGSLYFTKISLRISAKKDRKNIRSVEAVNFPFFCKHMRPTSAKIIMKFYCLNQRYCCWPCSPPAAEYALFVNHQLLSCAGLGHHRIVRDITTSLTGLTGSSTRAGTGCTDYSSPIAVLLTAKH